MAHSSEFASPQALSTCTTIRSPVSSLKCSNTEISPFTVYSNASEIDTPCLKFFPTDSELDKTSQFRVQNKITSVVKKSPRTYNEAVLLYKYLKTSTFFQRFREENRSLRVTDALIHLSRNLRYNVYPPGAVIHRKGDKSNGRIYLIFSGKVALSTETYQHDIQQDYSRPSRFKLENPPGSLNNVGMEVTPKSRILPTRVGTMTDIGLQKTLNQQLPFVSNQLKKIVKTIRLNNKNIVMMQSVSQVNRSDSKTPVNNRKEDIKLSMLKSLNKISNPSCPDGDRTVKASYTESRASLENLEVVSKQKAQRIMSDAMDTSMEIDLTQVIDLKLKREKSNSKISKSNLVLKRSNAVRTAVLDASEVHEEEEPDSVNSLDNYIERGLKRILGRGDMFGDEALKDLTYVQSSLWTDEREFTVEAVGDKECEVLSFGKEDLEMLHARYDKSNTCVLDFLIDHVPKLEKLVKHENGRQFEEMFTEETLTWHQNVTVQGEKGTKVYLLFDGLCEILKNYYSSAGETGVQNEFGAKKRAESLIKDFSKKAKSILICILKPGVFLGEEILFNGTSDYEYTVKAGSTQAKLLSIEKETLLKYFPVEILKEMNKLHKEKVKQNMEIFSKKIQLQFTGIKDNKSKQTEAQDSPSEKQQQKTTTFVGHMNRKATKTLALLTGKMYQTLKVTVNSETPAPARVTMKDMTWDQRKRSEPSLYQESRLMRTLTPEMFKHTMEMSQFRRTPSVMQNNSKVKENSRGFEGLEHGRKSVEVKGHKFDFGKDALGKSLLEKAKEREREDERMSVTNMRAKMMKEISALSTKKFIVKNYHVPTTPRAGQENVCSNSNSMTTLTPRKMTGSLDISLKIRNIEKVEEECFSERRNTLQKVAMDKHGRAYSIVGQEGSKPLKNEARDIYPLMGVSGKPVNVKKKSCKRL